MTTSPGRRDGFDGSKLFCSLMISCLLLTCLMMGLNSCRMPWMQSLILLCAFVLLNFKQLKKWSPKGSRSFPQEHVLYDEICFRGSRSLRIAVVLNACGENRKKRFVLGGSVKAFDVLELRRHGRIVLNKGSSG